MSKQAELALPNNRDHRAVVLLSEDEHRAATRIATDLGLSLSSWVRALILQETGERLGNSRRDREIERVWQTYKAQRKPDGRPWHIGAMKPEHRAMISSRLREGFAADDLMVAVEALHQSRYHQEGGFLALKYALGSGDKVELWIAKRAQVGRPRAMSAAEEWLRGNP